MWNDIETVEDLVNFKVVADAGAQLIREAGGQAISIGVSGNWGVGKSSLVKMIGQSLQEKSGQGDGQEFVFLDFNAWLYQGYDDARGALLQSVGDELLKQAEQRKTSVDKVKSFLKRINWFRVGALGAPVIAGALMGGAVGGPVGAVIGAVGGAFKNGNTPNAEDWDSIKAAYDSVNPQLKTILRDEEIRSLPKEISELRKLFSDILEELEITLVVLVDDLDRCLPETAISTLEAMRLLLFLPRTAFIIAADEQMIRNAVRSHFGDGYIDNDLVTSYFDKLIQVPLRVPRLGVDEIKAYMILLFADLAKRQGRISENSCNLAKKKILEALKKSWKNPLSRDVIVNAYGDEASQIDIQIDMANQLAPLMVSARQIAGNPRLIKRFLNDLMIRRTIAEAQGMSLKIDALVKVQLFERCASSLYPSSMRMSYNSSRLGFVSDI